MAIKAISMPDGRTIYVEVEEADVPVVSPPDSGRPGDLPEGAEPTGVADTVVNTMRALQQNIGVMVETVYESLKQHQPQEWTLEMNIGFKGKISPVPVILSGETEGAIKITATWKRS